VAERVQFLGFKPKDEQPQATKGKPKGKPKTKPAAQGKGDDLNLDDIPF